MKAIVLSAGQGRRLLPLTAHEPKCLLELEPGATILELQLASLARCGVERAVVAVGFGAERVERRLASARFPGLRVETAHNPFFATSDNLATCWVLRHAMNEDFLLLNGDTVFADAALRRLLDASPEVRIAVDRKRRYDDDDMKVATAPDGRLLAIGKALAPERVDAEAIGLLAFQGSGPKRFQEALGRALRAPGALHAWYPSALHDLAQQHRVDTVSVEGLWWREIDTAADLEEARASLPPRRLRETARPPALVGP